MVAHATVQHTTLLLAGCICSAFLLSYDAFVHSLGGKCSA